MLVNKISNPTYNYNFSRVDRKQNDTSFQAHPIIKPEKIVTKKNLLGLSMFLTLVSLAINNSDAENYPWITWLSSASLLGSFSIKEKPLQLDKEIEFKKADSLDEARAYAENTLGIKNFKIDDLDYANWINEGLTNISNKFEGEVYFPSTIEFTDKKCFGEYLFFKDKMRINKSYIEKSVAFFERCLKSWKYDDMCKYALGLGYDSYCKELKKAFDDIESLSLFEKFALYKSSMNAREAMSQANPDDLLSPNYKHKESIYGNVYESKFDLIYHEVGHCFFAKSLSFLRNLLNRFKYNSVVAKLKIPFYDKSSTDEYLATTFAGLMHGNRFSEENLQPYKKIARFNHSI